MGRGVISRWFAGYASVLRRRDLRRLFGGLVISATPLVALVFTALTAASSVVYQPATAATIPSLVDEDNLAAANALNSTIDELVVIAGPAVGAVLLMLGSPALVFAINAGELRI